MTTHGGRQATEAECTEFIRARGDALHRTAYWLTGDPALADDLVQDTLMRVFMKWHDVDPDARAGYARRVLANRYKRGWRRRWRAEDPYSDLPDSPVDGWDTVDLRVTLTAALSRLPVRMRAVLVLRFYADMTQEDVAEALHVSVGTVKSQTSKALVRLRADDALRPRETSKEA